MENVKEKFSDLPKKWDLENVRNVTLYKLKLIYENQLLPDMNVSILLTPLQDISNNLNQKLENVLKNSKETSGVTAMLLDKLTKNNEKMDLEIQTCGKLEQNLVQNANNILDMKRTLEVDVEKMSSEICEKMKETSKSMDEALKERYLNFFLILLIL